MATATRPARARRKQRYELQPYRSVHGESGAIAYAAGRDYIVVQFKSEATYLYTYRSAGRSHIEAMKQRAVRGGGLSGYISRNTHEKYEKKLEVIGHHLVAG